MGIFDIFKKNKDSANDSENNSTSYLENYFKSKLKVDTTKISYSTNDIARIEKNCEIIEKMGLSSYKELKLVPVDSIVTIEDKQELALRLIFDFFVGRKAINRLNADYGIVISNKTSSIEKDEDIIYISPKTFSLL